MCLFPMLLTSPDNLLISLTGPGITAIVLIFHYASPIIMGLVRIQLQAVIELYYLQVIRNVMVLLHQNILIYGQTEILRITSMYIIQDGIIALKLTPGDVMFKQIQSMLPFT